MNFRKISLVLAAAAALSPAISNASPGRTALDACAKAFATSLASNGAAAPTYKIAYGSGESAWMTDQYYAHEFAFDLQARDPKTRVPLARASCSATLDGTIISLSSMPL